MSSILDVPLLSVLYLYQLHCHLVSVFMYNIAVDVGTSAMLILTPAWLKLIKFVVADVPVLPGLYHQLHPHNSQPRGNF